MVPPVPQGGSPGPIAGVYGGRLRSRDSRPQHWWVGLGEGATASVPEELREKRQARRLRQRDDAAARIDGLGLGAVDVAGLAGDVGEEREGDEEVRDVRAEEGGGGDERGEEPSRVGAAMKSGAEDVGQAGYDERRSERTRRWNPRTTCPGGNL